MKQKDPIPLLELQNIEKRFLQHMVLNKVSLQLYPGKITALIGDNGAGKSTLVKIITNQLSPDNGHIYWQQQLIPYNKMNNPKNAHNLGIQAVYQHLGLIDNLSILRNFFLGNELCKGILPFRRLDLERMRQVTSEQLQRFGLTHKLHPDHIVTSLSGGERQIIDICRAMYFNAKLLILDEPTSALSNRHTDLVNEHIKKAAQANIAILLITHRSEQVDSIADNVLTLSYGRIINRDV